MPGLAGLLEIFDYDEVGTPSRSLGVSGSMSCCVLVPVGLITDCGWEGLEHSIGPFQKSVYYY